MLSSRARGAKFKDDRRGGVALITALALPPLLLISLGAIQLQAVFADRALTQDVADSAALWGAAQIAISPNGAKERTQAFAEAMLSKVAATSSMQISVEPVGEASLKVMIDTNRPSFFMNMFPAGGFNTHAESTAEAQNQVPLCVLVFGDAAGANLKLGGKSDLEAGACLVHSNQDVQVDNGGLLRAYVTQAVKGAKGPITPAALTGAAKIPDPFDEIGLTLPAPCASGKDLLDVPITAPTTLSPGLHCGKYTVKDGATVTLVPGDHYFSGDLKLEDTSRLVGDDVVLVFDAKTKFEFKGNSTVSLNGRRTGPLAGFVIAASRSNDKEFKIESDHVSNLLGTVYVPTAKLIVEGSQKVAQASDWTVITAKGVELRGEPQLVINSNYAESDVPVPKGVGPTKAMSRLVQ